MPARKRRIAVVTGSRAEYGILQSTLRAIQKHPQLELQLVVTGMHLLRRFGCTARQIERDGWPIAARIPMQRGDDSPTDQAQGLGRGVAGLATFFARARPDVVLVLGDRIEAMAAALAAVTTGRVLAHIHGGDVAEGDFDDSLRHAITKLAHIHFPATRAAARRILRMGERPDRVFHVGAPGLDRLRELLNDPRPTRQRGGGTNPNPPRERRARRETHRRHADANGPYALVIQHAYGRPAAVEERVARIVLGETAAAGLHRTIIHPNSDRGHAGVLRAIERHVRESCNGDVELFRSLPRDAFLRAMHSAAIVLGNSSCGLIEAPFAGVPSIDVGERQAGRERGGPAVVHAGEDGESVRRAIRRALRSRSSRSGAGPYGDGHAGARIAAALAQVGISAATSKKRLTY